MAQLEMILDECLERIHHEVITLEECLSEHSQLRDELEPLLRASLQLKGLSQVSGDTAAKDRIRTKVLAHAKEQSKPKSRMAWRWPQQRRLAFSLLAIFLGFFSTGTVLAQSALPGQTLYPLKLWSERVYFSFNNDPLDAHLRLSNRRAAEYLATSATQEVAEQAYMSYLLTLADLSNDLAKNTDLFSDELRLSEIKTQLTAQKQRFEQAGIQVTDLDDLIKSVEVESQSPNDHSPTEEQDSGKEESSQDDDPSLLATTVPEILGN